MAKVIDLTDPQRRFAIESGIPISPQNASTSTYPFAAMEVGQSFAVGGSFRDVANVRSAANYWNRTHPPMKFAVRIVRATGQHRCWRVA